MPASATRDLAFCLFPSILSVPWSPTASLGPGASLPCCPPGPGCASAAPWTGAASLLRKAQAYELGGVKRVRNLYCLKERPPCCAPSSSDSPSCAGHRLISPEDLAGVCFPFPRLLTARHGEPYFGSAAMLHATGSSAAGGRDALHTGGWELI